jgi:hypothetical protein
MEMFVRANAGDGEFENWWQSNEPGRRERIMENAGVVFEIELPAIARFVPDNPSMRRSGVPLTPP